MYLQTGFYDEKQMKNIDGFFSGDLKRAPMVLFSDNYVDAVYGFGIPASFEKYIFSFQEIVFVVFQLQHFLLSV